MSGSGYLGGSAAAGKLICVIGDEDTVTGFLLAGVGHKTASGENYFVVDSKTSRPSIEEAFKRFTQRPDVGIVLINQHCAQVIRYLIDDYSETIPTVLEIPSRDHPYDPSSDTIMNRVNLMLGLQQ